jgi:L-lactate dehydrogenase complex protein LldG
MTMSSRDTILNKLRSARRPFEDAAPRPTAYMPVTEQGDFSPDALLERFTLELEQLKGQVFPVDGDAGARDKVLELLAFHQADHIIAWDFAHIPVEGLESAIREVGITITQPDTRDESRADVLAQAESAQVGLTGADAATTGSLVFTTAPGKGRIPTILAPIYIAVIQLDQIVPRIEDWLTAQRQQGLGGIRSAANVCFISGPSRTADIEMQLVLGVHGPGQVQVVVKR